MNEATVKMIQGWSMHRGDKEAVARWMRDSLRLGGLKACREMVEAVSA